jgi:hypothetical protein
MNQSNNQSAAQMTQPERKPNETSGFHFASSIKITDPNTKQVLLQKRAD